jgi:polar amino acid transport system substrate-binding protein
MRAWRFSFLAVLLLAALLVACGGDDDDGGSDAAGSGESTALEPPGSLVRDGSLSLCADLSFPPMSFEDPSSKEPTGFDIDTARAVADAWGVELQIQNMPFDGVLPALSSGRCDIAWTGINVTDERLKTFNAVPYLKTGEVIIVPEGDADAVTKPEDLAGRTVATQSGTIYVDRLKKLAKDLEASGEAPPRIQTYPKMSDAIQQLVVGRAEAVVTQDTEAAYRSTQQPGEFELAYTYPDALEFGAYFTKDNAEMETALTEALQSLAQDGTLKATAEKFGLSPDNLVVR